MVVGFDMSSVEIEIGIYGGSRMSYLRWVSTMLKAPEWRRKEWVKELINGFREYRIPKDNNPAEFKDYSKKQYDDFDNEDYSKDDKTKKYLSDILEEEKEVYLIGFVPKIEYIKVEGRDDELGVIWEHPHMNPALIYKHRTLPYFIIAGPGLRHDDSVLNEIGMRSQKVRGITG